MATDAQGLVPTPTLTNPYGFTLLRYVRCAGAAAHEAPRWAALVAVSVTRDGVGEFRELNQKRILSLALVRRFLRCPSFLYVYLCSHICMCAWAIARALSRPSHVASRRLRDTRARPWRMRHMYVHALCAAPCGTPVVLHPLDHPHSPAPHTHPARGEFVGDLLHEAACLLS